MVKATASPGLRSRILVPINQRRELFGQAGWVAIGFAAQQALRLATNIALAWLLAPALLGLMLLINTLRTGGELLSDVGIGQSVVNNPRGHDADFLSTAWTLKIIRGLILFVLMLLLSSPIAELYDEPQLKVILPVSASVFILSGLTSPSRYVLQKQMAVRTLVLFDLAMSGVSLVVHLVLALISPTIWALVGGLVIGTAASTLASFFLVRNLHLALRLKRQAATEILHFGKWIFFASLVYFLASNFDRLYFADSIPFAVLGVYGIARTFSDTVQQMFQRMGNLIIFPKISAAGLQGAELRNRIAPVRMQVLIATAIVMGAMLAVADQFIILAYDQRYAAAGLYLTVLLVSTWFAILGSMTDALLMGVGKPASIGTSNLARLAVLGVALPVALPQYGLAMALFAFAAAEAARYSVLVWRTRTIGIGFGRQDMAATVLFLLGALFFREMTYLADLTDGVSGWIDALRTSHD